MPLGNHPISGWEPAFICTQFAVNHAPANATQATISQAAAAAGMRNICQAISATLSATGTAADPVQVNLRDGATGAGTILLSAALAAPVNGSAIWTLSGLRIRGTAATAMTLEFANASAANTFQCVSMFGQAELSEVH